jgi:hypothetical protein
MDVVYFGYMWEVRQRIQRKFCEKLFPFADIQSVFNWVLSGCHFKGQKPVYKFTRNVKVTVAISNIKHRPETYAVPTHFLWRLFAVLMYAKQFYSPF